MDRRTAVAAVRILIDVVLVGLLTGVTRIWRLRALASAVVHRLPEPLRRGPVELHAAVESEYAGTWTVDPDTARRRLRREFGFEETLWSELQAYDRDGRTVFEAGNFVYRPDGYTGRWQLHVRLFPTADGLTEVWPHWELNVLVHPDAHRAGKLLDPQAGERRLRERIGDELVRPGGSAKTGPP